MKKNYKYLGFKLDCDRNFNETINDLANKGKRALFSEYQISTFNHISVKTILDVFRTTIKPILL